MRERKTIISASNLSKNFARQKHHNVSRNLNDVMRNILCLPPLYERDQEEFWAVKNISIDIKSGDSIGLVGRNGSGKTTLLRMLSGLLAPTIGSISISGEIQALINLGAGFNPRLSGRENVTNGIALRGLSPRKNKILLEQIIDFSEIGTFLDAPVETYSSGMKARLGFALCVFMKPDVIVIDEALSVGDIAFQNKCKLQLQAMKQEGVAMLLVSHSMTSIRQFCDRAIWLHEGSLRVDGDVESVITEYLAFMDRQEVKRNLPDTDDQAISVKTEESTTATVAQPTKVEQSKAFSLPREYQGSAAKPISEPLEVVTKQDLRWERPSISHQHVKELYGGHFESSVVENFRAAIISGNKAATIVPVNRSFALEYAFELSKPVPDLNVSLVFHTKDGNRLATISTLNGDLLKDVNGSTVAGRARVHDACFAPGEYVVTISVHDGSAYLWRDAILAFRVSPGDYMIWNQISLSYDYVTYSGSKEINPSAAKSERTSTHS